MILPLSLEMRLRPLFSFLKVYWSFCSPLISWNFNPQVKGGLLGYFPAAPPSPVEVFSLPLPFVFETILPQVGFLMAVFFRRRSHLPSPVFSSFKKIPLAELPSPPRS